MNTYDLLGIGRDDGMESGGWIGFGVSERVYTVVYWVVDEVEKSRLSCC